MEWTVVVTILTGVIVAAIAAWKNENGKFKSAANANVKLNQKVNKLEGINKRKNKEIKELFRARLDDASAEQLAGIINSMLEDSRGQGTDTVSNGEGS